MADQKVAAKDLQVAFKRLKSSSAENKVSLLTFQRQIYISKLIIDAILFSVIV